MPAYTRERASEYAIQAWRWVTNPRKRITKRGKHTVQSNPESLCYIMWGTPHHRTLPKLWQVRTYIPTYLLGQMKCAVPCFVVVQYLCGSGVGTLQPASQPASQPAGSSILRGVCGWVDGFEFTFQKEKTCMTDRQADRQLLQLFLREKTKKRGLRWAEPNSDIV